MLCQIIWPHIQPFGWYMIYGHVWCNLVYYAFMHILTGHAMSLTLLLFATILSSLAAWARYIDTQGSWIYGAMVLVYQVMTHARPRTLCFMHARVLCVIWRLRPLFRYFSFSILSYLDASVPGIPCNILDWLPAHGPIARLIMHRQATLRGTKGAALLKWMSSQPTAARPHR